MLDLLLLALQLPPLDLQFRQRRVQVRQRGVPLGLPPCRVTPCALDLARFHGQGGRPQLDTRQPLDPLGFQAAVVNPDRVPRQLQSLVGLLGPDCAGFL